jgi:hypothetical protein
MGVRIKDSKTFKAIVNFETTNEAGKREPQFFTAEFKRLPPAEVIDVTSTAQTIDEMVRRVLVGWTLKELDSKEDIPFSEENLDMLLALIPGFGGVIMQRYIDTVGASRGKN